MRSSEHLRHGSTIPLGIRLLLALLLAGPILGTDCNQNGVEDAVDIASGASGDCNGNGVPDECDIAGRIDFAAAVHLAVSYWPESVIAADLDGDGDRDLAVASLSGISILLNDGEEGFADAKTLTEAGNAIAAADFDGDGDVDLATVNANQSIASILLNGGDAEFVLADTRSVGDGPAAIAAGDIDGDGVVDVIVANMDSDSLSVLRNDGDGTLTAAPAISVGVAPRAVALADLDADGDLDAAVANSFYGNDGSVSILANDGTGAFTATAAIPIAKGPSDVIAADLDGDKDPDLALAQDLSSVTLLLNEGSLNFAAPVIMEVPSAYRLVASDVDRDGDRDLVVSQSWSNSVVLLRNGGDASFITDLPLRVQSRPWGLACEDLDGDGAPDVVAANSESDTVTIIRNDGRGQFLVPRDVPAGRSPRAMAVADLDGDADLDVAVANGNGSDIAILRNDGAGSFEAAARIALSDNPEAIVAGDFDGDGDTDLVVRDDEARIQVYANDGAGGFEMIFAGDGGSKDVRAADLDLDGDLDLLVADLPSQSVSVLRNTGHGAFEPPAPVPVGFGPLGLAVADFDRDGAPDFIALGDTALTPTGVPFWNDGSGGFTPGESFRSLVFAYTAETGDLDGDGDADLVAAGPYENAPGVAVIGNAGAGSFSALGPVLSSSDVRGLGLADLDADGDLDVLAAEFRTGHIAVFLNRGDGTFAAPRRFASGPEPVAVAAADLDGDGDLDMVALNKDTGDVSIIPRRPLRPTSLDANGNGIPDECEGAAFRRGDANGDGRVDAADAVWILSELFRSGRLTSCRKAADANDDGLYDVGDALAVLGYIFFKASPLPQPFGRCGTDPTPDELGCSSFPPCQ